MKKADWIIASLLILFGISCLIISMTFIEHSETVHMIMMIAMKCMLWMGLPLIVIGLIYVGIKNRFRKRD